MIHFPLSPSLSRTLIESCRYGCSIEVATIVALLSVEDIFVRPRKRDKQEDAAEAHKRLQSEYVYSSSRVYAKILIL